VAPRGLTKHYTEDQRTALVELVTTGQATPRAAAAQLGVTESTAYYWLKRARKRPALALVRQVARAGSATRSRLTAPTFARLTRATEAPSAITLRVAGAEIEVRSGFDPALLRDVISALVEDAP
jgi:transposase-like protein